MKVNSELKIDTMDFNKLLRINHFLEQYLGVIGIKTATKLGNKSYIELEESNDKNAKCLKNSDARRKHAEIGFTKIDRWKTMKI